MAAEDGAFPTLVQLDLLRAALLPAEHAGPAWRRWRAAGLALERLDDPSRRMLSQMWANRRAAGVEAEDEVLLRGAYQEVWAHNAFAMAAVVPGVRALEAVGIPAVLLKGAALLAVAGDRMGVRRLADADVLVPEARAGDALEVLRRAGFTPVLPPVPEVRRTRHAWGLSNRRGGDLDLHWWAYKTPGDDAEVFAQARSASLLGEPVQVPAPAELLLLTVVHGLGPHPAAMRWIGDAMLLLQLEGAVLDWDALVRRARAREVTVAAVAGLGFLARELHAPVPAEALRALGSPPSRRRSRWAHHAAISPSGRGAFYAMELESHRRRRRHDPAGTPWDFPGHLAQVVGLPNRRALARLALARALRSRGRRAVTWEQAVAEATGVGPGAPPGAG